MPIHKMSSSSYPAHPFIKKALIGCLLTGLIAAPVWKVSAEPADTVQIRGGISVGAKGEEIIPSLSLRDASIVDVLYSLSEQAGFNLIVDDSVSGTLSLDLKNTSINKVLEYILTLGDLTYYQDGNTFIITSTSTGETKALNKLVLKSVPVKYSNAEDLADVLKDTVFSVNRPGGNSKAIATADPRTNSLLIMGNEMDIELANRALAELDFPLQHKTFFLKNAVPKEVANTLAQTLFSVSLTSSSESSDSSGKSSGDAGSSGSAGGTTNTSSGANNASTGGSGGSSGGSTGSVEVLKGGPVTFIANAANNTLTLIGTAQQIELAEAMLYDVDIKPAQVAIQVSIIELDEGKNKSFEPFFNGLGPNSVIGGRHGGFSSSIGGTTIYWGNTGMPPTVTNTQAFSSLAFNTAMSQNKAKVLSNPTLMAVSGKTSTMNVSREVQGPTKVTQSGNPPITTQEETKDTVGIRLSITPTVANDGTVSLKLAPSVSSPNGRTTGGATLKSDNTLDIAEARVKDGETLVLGGLISESVQNNWRNDIPFLSDIPIIGALFKNQSTNNVARQELIIMVTPHIIKEEGVPYFRKEWRDNLSYSSDNPATAPAQNNAGMVPAAGTDQSKLQEGFQSLEQKRIDGQGLKGSTAKSKLPVSTFSEVLK